MKKMLFTVLVFGLLVFSGTTSTENQIPEAEKRVSTVQEAQVSVEEYESVLINELTPEANPLQVSTFREVWAYVVAGSEAALTPGLPITDVGYFTADVNTYGRLVSIPNRRNLPAHYTGRVHLVVKCDGRALSNFVLLPGTEQRRNLIRDLINATRNGNYDGLNIDLENIPQDQNSANNFFTFLQEIKRGLGNDKMFTIAIAARTRKLQVDVYDYERITPLMDRVFVMAYDEHWSGSRPGPIASMDWCRNVAAYSLRTIGRQKLVMGIPFYGRAWANTSPARAYIYSGIDRIKRENDITEVRRENGIPTFNYDVTVTVTVYYEDEYSISTRMEMYRSMGVEAVGFWRLGQETTAVWDYIRVGTGTQNTNIPRTSSVSSQSSNDTTSSQSNFQATHKVSTGGSNLRLRNGQGLNATIIGVLEDGSYVRVLNTGASWVDNNGNRGNWTYITTSDGKTGWCFGAYLQSR